MTTSEENQLSYGALISGIVLSSGGVFGIWFQGDFWGHLGGQIRGNLNVRELYWALGLPAGVTVVGALLFMWAALGSPVAHRWTFRRRNTIAGCYAVLLIISIILAAILGSHHLWATER